jgi:uncharacterized protein (DUF488 family)
LKKQVFTIGHSTHSLEEFIQMLKSFEIKQLVDIRNYPGSRRYPHFNKESLAISLAQEGIDYIHCKDLGGRRKTNVDSHNTRWRLPAFRGYADYMEAEPFKKAIEELQILAHQKRTAYMCSEAVWWRCHRALVSDYLKNEGWTVTHIMGIGKGEEHPFTSPARIVEGRLVYSDG